MDYSLFTPAHCLLPIPGCWVYPQGMTESTPETITAENGAKLSRTRFLRPPWPKGVSGNPSGRTKAGEGTKDQPLRALLRAKARKRSELRRLVDALWERACDPDNPSGNGAMEQILKRLDPVLDDPTQGRTILEGLKLELREGKASVTLLRGRQASSDAETSERDSGGGASTIQASDVQDVPHEEKGSQEPSRSSEKVLSRLGDAPASPSPSGSSSSG